VAGVRAIGPGEIVHVNDGGVHSRRYWDLLTCAAASHDGDDGEVRARTASLLEEAAALHMISDVPVGLFLSGGIDSSAIAALLRRGGYQPRTFAVTCPGTPFDEAPYARAVARAVGADHTEISLTERDVLEQVQQGVLSVDHPSGDGLNTYIVARAVRQAGMKVALSGLGGDEFFGGYRSFDRVPRLSRYAKAWRWSPAPVRQAASAAVRSVGAGSVTAVKTAALVATDGSLPQTFPILRQVFSPEQRHELLLDPARTEPDPYVALLDEAVSRQTNQDLMALVSYAEARTYMHDVLLRDADQMSMAHGLEVRVPLLDHVLVEHLMGLPQAAKRAGSGPKPLLVRSVAPDLPVECVDRPKKGFVLPFDLWMRDSLRPFCELHLGPRGLLGWGLFQPAAVRSLWSAFLSDERRTTWSRPWTLVALDAWMRANQIEP
jgi:asparagine synthase (glutamine-hydrolysing)